jgi:hypothetical protein
MNEEGMDVERIPPDERAWRDTVERDVGTDQGCVERAERLQASRDELDDGDPEDAPLLGRTAVLAVIALAVPVIMYTEFVAPSGGVNYAGLGTGLALMIVGVLAYL